MTKSEKGRPLLFSVHIQLSRLRRGGIHKTSLQSHYKRLRDFEVGSIFGDTPEFIGTIRHPLFKNKVKN